MTAPPPSYLPLTHSPSEYAETLPLRKAREARKRQQGSVGTALYFIGLFAAVFSC